MSHWARAGIKCVCLNSDWRRGSGLGWKAWIRGSLFGWPVRGGVYLIRAVVAFDGAIWLQLDGWGNVMFRVELFKPLVDDQQARDVALFTPLLDTKRVKPAAPARERMPE